MGLKRVFEAPKVYAVPRPREVHNAVLRRLFIVPLPENIV
jgi:hypothetical protein